MHVVVAQLNFIVGDIAGNCRKISSAISSVKERSAQLIIFSELAITGYPPEDLLLQPAFVDAAMKALDSIIPETAGISAVIGLPRFVDRQAVRCLANSAAVLSDGVLLGFQDKTLLPTYDVFDEARYFSSPLEQRRLWQLAGKRVGITICEDIWDMTQLPRPAPLYKENVLEALAALAPELVLNLSASPFNRGKNFLRNQVASNAATAIGAPLLLCNQIGGNDGLIFDGRSLYVDAQGRVLAQAPGFKESLLSVNISQPAAQHSDSSDIAGENDADDIAELYRALVLGTKDYLHKLGFKKACVGLSGGIDSAVVACIAADALGSDNVLGIAMPSRYSSKGSVSDAQQLANALHIEYRKISIERPFQSYLDLLEPLFLPHPPDVTEENIQARIRGMILMAFSNKLGPMVLSTGNKSELALGYATLYGDMCGGLAVIADVLKGSVYSLAKWINRHGEVIPNSTINKAPSAELRPGQYDSDTLPPYDLVDTVVAAYIEEGLSGDAIAHRYGYPIETVQRLVVMINRNEYKRRQGALALRVTPKAFSLGRRYPIVHGFAK